MSAEVSPELDTEASPKSRDITEALVLRTMAENLPYTRRGWRPKRPFGAVANTMRREGELTIDEMSAAVQEVLARAEQLGIPSGQITANIGRLARVAFEDAVSREKEGADKWWEGLDTASRRAGPSAQ